MTIKKPTLLYGASGHGLVVADILKEINDSDIFFTDDNKKGVFHGFMILNPESLDLTQYNCIITIGYNKIRKTLSEKINVQFINAIHKSTIISTNCQIGQGVVCAAGTIINTHSSLGDHCIINTGATIDHECVIESFVHISPGAHLAGNVSVGEGAHVGIGASVLQGIKIGKWSTIGAGAVVTKDVADFDTVVGVPARSIRTKKG